LLPGALGLGRVPLRPMNRQEGDPMNPSGSLSRRQLLKSAGVGFGYVALAGMLGQRGTARAEETLPLAPKIPHFAPRAKRIIFLFMSGSMSQLDTFEYKPRLQKDDGKEGPGGGTLTASKFKFRKYGESGTW